MHFEIISKEKLLEIVRNLELGNCFSVSATLCSNWVSTLQKEKVHVYKSCNSQGV